MGKKLHLKIDQNGNMKITRTENVVLINRKLEFKPASIRLKELGCEEQISFADDVELCKRKDQSLFTVLQYVNPMDNSVITQIMDKNFDITKDTNIRELFISEQLLFDTDKKDVKIDISPEFIVKMKGKK